MNPPEPKIQETYAYDSKILNRDVSYWYELWDDGKVLIEPNLTHEESVHEVDVIREIEEMHKNDVDD